MESDRASRNARLDDLKAFVFDAAVEHDELSNWLTSHLRRMQEDPAFEETRQRMEGLEDGTPENWWHEVLEDVRSPA